MKLTLILAVALMTGCSMFGDSKVTKAIDDFCKEQPEFSRADINKACDDWNRK